jgi:chromosomal replication initiator protein
VGQRGRPAASPPPATLDAASAQVDEATRVRCTGSRLNERYTFDNFIRGDCNQLASNAALAIADTPSEANYNPLFIYGGVGLGKTHLVQAIGNHILGATAEPRRVHYVSSDSFTSQFVASIQNNQIPAFKEFYRQVDVLIVDDIQFFSGKEKTQEEFFHIFNDLYQRGKQIILCADRSPQEIQEVEDRLLSRFRVGLSADMQRPDYETRTAILQHKADNQGLMLNGEVVSFLARSITHTIRDLEGAINKLQFLSETAGISIDVPVARQALTDLVDGSTTRIEIEDIQKRVAGHFGITM